MDSIIAGIMVSGFKKNIYNEIYAKIFFEQKKNWKHTQVDVAM